MIENDNAIEKGKLYIQLEYLKFEETFTFTFLKISLNPSSLSTCSRSLHKSYNISKEN